MTFRHKDAFGTDSSGNPCVQFDTSGDDSVLKIFQDSDPDDNSLNPPIKYTLSHGWKIKLRGRTSAAGFPTDDNDGIVLQATTACTISPQTVVNGIVLIPITPPYSGFYSTSVNDDVTFSIRYKRSNPSQPPPDICTDEDACEDMGKLKVTATGPLPGTGQVTDQVVDCPNGECLVKIVDKGQ